MIRIFFIHIIRLKNYFELSMLILSYLNDWFCASKLSLNTDKTKYVLFHKAKRKKIFIWFFQIYLLMTLKSKEKNHRNHQTHVELAENKISICVEIIFKATRSLNSKSLRNIHFALVHPYINYVNIAWAATNKTYLKRILGNKPLN